MICIPGKKEVWWAPRSRTAMRAAGRLLLFLSGLLCAARGLRVISSPHFNCSQPGIQCVAASDDCLDPSWSQQSKWTPAAPSYMEVTMGIGLNDRGYRVPLLWINWTVSVEAGILTLEGAQISVLEVGSGQTRCVRFQFGNTFPNQRDENKQPWRFFYNNFEVHPGNKYQISVQHLPPQGHVNRKEQEFVVPECGDADMMQTDSCCRLGLCWNPSISLEFSGDKLIVTFTPRRDALEYGVQVRIGPPQTVLPLERVILKQGANAERVQVNFSNPIRYKPCFYNISVWPYMPSCDTDCRRLWYTPKCHPTPDKVETTPVPPGPRYVWPIAALVTVMAFMVTVILLWRFRACISPSVKPPIHLPPLVPPPLVKQKVWLVYSADHRLYINAVIKLADFLRVAWGLDVVLDRHQSAEIGIKGAMTWLSYQKDQIEKMNGTILILCSSGAQAKWRAMQNRQETRVRLPEDASYVFGDLFTPALALILPDFLKGKPYDRYVVAYFSDLCDVGDIPSPLEICPCYALIENLQLLLFRIQRIERHQPNVQYNIDLEREQSYRHLVKAIEQCRAWQETHLDWFGREYSQVEAKDESIEEEEAGHELTCRAFPQIRRPETSVSKLTPCIIEPDSIRLVNPSLMVGPLSICVVPLLNEERSPVTVVQPSLNTEALRVSYRQQPYLVNIDESVPICNEYFGQMDLIEQDVKSENLNEAQKRFFCQSISKVNPDLLFSIAKSSSSVDLTVNGPLLPIDMSTPQDQGGQSVDLREAQKKFFCQSILEGHPGGPSVAFKEDHLFAGDDSVYERLRQIDLSIQRQQDVRAEELKEAQRKFFFQSILDDEYLAPDVASNDDSPLFEHRPLLVQNGIPVPTLNEPLLQSDGQGSQSTALGATQEHWSQPKVPGGQRAVRDADDELDIYAEYSDLYQDFQRPHAVIGQTDNMNCHSEDLGYGTWNHNNLEPIEAE
ncbi:interleukin-17 receptor A isoform X2 [Eleutherodactylus coqui]